MCFFDVCYLSTYLCKIYGNHSPIMVTVRSLAGACDNLLGINAVRSAARSRVGVLVEIT